MEDGFILQIGIIGLGLIGGSLAKAFKKNQIVHITALDLDEHALQKALEEKMINDYTTVIDHHFLQCDVIFLCTPVNQIPAQVQSLLPWIKSGCILTDVGSTKGSLLKEIEPLCLDSIYFIGGHPMTGSEQTGYMASKAHLFENAYYILSPLGDIPTESMLLFTTLIESIGAIPIVLSPVYHDYVVAAISHVPHILAASLVNLVKALDEDSHDMHRLAAGGFKDITRIASSSPHLWQTICKDNSTEIFHVMDTFKTHLLQFEEDLRASRDDQIHSFFDTAREYRNTFSNRSPGPFVKTYEIIVDVEDLPGIIAEIATLLSKHHINIKNIGISNNREFENGVLQILFSDEQSQQKSILLLQQMNYSVYVK